MKIKILISILLVLQYSSDSLSQNPWEGWENPIQIEPSGQDGNIISPFIGLNDTVLYFVAAGPSGYDDIFVSYFTYGAWGPGYNLGLPINTSGIEKDPSISGDGKTLFFARYGGTGTYGLYDIWYSNWQDSTLSWGVPENLGEIINSAFNEWSPFISHDGSKLYFSSDENTQRRHGYGDFDIYVASWDSTNENWSNVTNLGLNVNSYTGDDYPSVTRDGRFLFFSSWGAHGDTNYQGGLDIFAGEWDGAIWGNVHNLGIPINAGDYDCCPSINSDMSKLYFSTRRNPQPEVVRMYYSDRPLSLEDHGEQTISSMPAVKIYPTPFNTRTTISYSLSQDSEIEIAIYDITGRKIETLVQRRQTAGEHSVVWDGKSLPSGLYFYKITAGNFSQTKSCVLLK